MLAKGASKLRTMKSITEARRFEKMTVAFLRSVGAVDSDTRTDEILQAVRGASVQRELRIETTLGPLLLTPSTFSVHGKFLDVPRACALLNPKKQRGMKLDFRTGGWRHDYYQSPLSAEQALQDLKGDLLPLLPAGPPGQNPSIAWSEPSASLTDRDRAADQHHKAPPVQQEAWKGEWRTRYTRVAGVTYPNADGSDRQSLVALCRVGERIEFVRERNNPHDPFAVRVERWDGSQVGYLPREVQNDAPWCVGPGMDEGYRYIARVAGVRQVEEGVWGMSLQVTFWNGPLASQPTKEPKLPPLESRYDTPHAPPSEPQGKWTTTHTSAAGATFHITDSTERQRGLRRPQQGEPKPATPPPATSTVAQKSGCLTLLCIAALFIMVVLLTR